MNDFRDRLIAEHKELVERIVKLRTFINADMFQILEKDEQNDMKAQLKGMIIYRDVLERRMRRKNLL